LGLYVAALGAALVFSTLRLRELALADAPFVLWLPFLRPLFSAAFEASLLLGVPIAWLAAWRAAGAERNIRSSRRPLVLLAFGLTFVSAGGAVFTDVGSAAPGLLAQELIDTGRASCESSPVRRVGVPLVAVAWACPLGAQPMVSGQSPGLGDARFRASSLRVTPDLRQIELRNVALELPAKKGRIAARISATRARVAGLPPWGRPRHVSLGFRLFTAFLGGLVAVLVIVLTLGGSAARAGAGLPIAALSGVALLFAEQALDRSGARPLSYWALAPLGALTAFGCVGLVRAGSHAARWARGRWSSR
jgi:hypothetical protein